VKIFVTLADADLADTVK